MNQAVDALEDGAAVEAARAGDAGAFGVLVERYQHAAFRSAYLVVRDAETAEDVCQEGFIRAYDHVHRVRVGEPYRPWLLRIVTNLALNHVRSRTRRRGLRERLRRAPQAYEAGPEPAVVAGERRELLLRAIEELPPGDRVVLYLRHFLELPEREIAAAIGKRPGTVKSRLHRAGGRLRAVIEERYPSLVPAELGSEEPR